MKVNSISFDDAGYPETATVVLTRKEMQLIAKFVGSRSPSDEFVPGHGGAEIAIYEELSRMVFHPFWEDGVDEAIRGSQS